MKRRGFTIVELLAVIAILAVLMTIIVTAATGVFRASRGRRTEAMRVALQAAIASYRAADSNGRWPGSLNSKSAMGTSGYLEDEEAQNVFRIIVQKATGANGTPLPLIDPSGLFVAPSGAKDGETSGLSFNEARQGTAKRQKLAVSNMLFGYPDESSGRFRRFHIYYSAASDSVSVKTVKTNNLNSL